MSETLAEAKFDHLLALADYCRPELVLHHHVFLSDYPLSRHSDHSSVSPRTLPSLAVAHLLTHHLDAYVYRLDGACQNDDYLEWKYYHIRCLGRSEKDVHYLLLTPPQSGLQAPELDSQARLQYDSRNPIIRYI